MVLNTWYDLPQHLSQLAYAFASIRGGLEVLRGDGPPNFSEMCQATSFLHNF